MNDSDNPQVAAEQAREKLGIDTPLPKAMRAVVEKNVAQTREVYERSKDALEAALETLERSFDALGQGTTALNHKVIDIAQRNINSGFDLAVSLTAAKNLAEVIELQAAYWRKQFGALADQAKEVRALSTEVTADVAKRELNRMHSLPLAEARQMIGKRHAWVPPTWPSGSSNGTAAGMKLKLQQAR